MYQRPNVFFRTLIALLTLGLGLSLPAQAKKRILKPQIGDKVNGKKLYEQHCLSCHGTRSDPGQAFSIFDGNRMSPWSNGKVMRLLHEGTDTHRAYSDDLGVLNLWDIMAHVRNHNSDIKALSGKANHVFAGKGTLDEFAIERLKEEGRISVDDSETTQWIFALYRIGEGEGLRRVPDDLRARDVLEPNTLSGFAVFIPLKGFRKGNYEAAISVDKDIRIKKIFIRAPDGSLPKDLNRAARRFVGKGGRGKYKKLRPGGSGRIVRDLKKPLSEGFLKAMEAVYMYERDERERFAL